MRSRPRQPLRCKKYLNLLVQFSYKCFFNPSNEVFCFLQVLADTTCILSHSCLYQGCYSLLVFSATFNNISVLLVDENDEIGSIWIKLLTCHKSMIKLLTCHKSMIKLLTCHKSMIKLLTCHKSMTSITLYCMDYIITMCSNQTHINSHLGRY
jgi:hypothetical protein